MKYIFLFCSLICLKTYTYENAGANLNAIEDRREELRLQKLSLKESQRTRLEEQMNQSRLKHEEHFKRLEEYRRKRQKGNRP